MILEDYDYALESYEKAISINKAEFYAYWGMGNVFMKKELNEKAFHYFSMAASLNPKCSIIYTYLGIVKKNIGKDEDALMYFEKT